MDKMYHNYHMDKLDQGKYYKYNHKIRMIITEDNLVSNGTNQ